PAARVPWSQPLRTTMSFVLGTSSTASEAPADAPSHHLDVVGYDRTADRLVLREQIGDDPAIAVYSVMPVAGPSAGTAIPLAHGTRAALRPLVPVEAADLHGWELTTRVIQRRGLRVFGDLAPIRKFALALTVQHRVGGLAIAQGRAVTTAYLRPRATLASVWTVPGRPIAVALVSYCGVPTGIGVDKQVAILAAPSWH
ncbi:MAG TPA: hypothetical protein VHE35_24245, partial [Kofleriaceae bacterium]|nr:hypothetical protein [Kofleriaceae bacterium]